MKRLLTSAAMFLCCITTSFAQFSGSGSGTENDPYQILNPIQLNQLRNFLNTSGVYFRLDANIDLTEFIDDEYPSQGWLPIGTSSTPFKGILDGNGKTISGLWIDRPNSDYVGFFGSLNYGTVKNLTLKGGVVKGKDYVGFLSGSDGDILDSSLEGYVNGSSHVGGCTGNRANITRVISTVDVSGDDYVGGISGENGSFNNCTVTNNYVSGHNFVGGICGNEDNRRDMNSCHVHSKISGNDYVGGICGQASRSSGTIPSITKCSFVGEVTANAYVGGICGQFYGEALINGCFAIGHVSGSGNFVGGIIGSSSHRIHYTASNSTSNCYFSGSVVGNEQVGGLIGYKSCGVVNNCYSHASVNGSKSVGGLFGKIEGASSSDKIISNVSIVTSVKAIRGNVGRIFGEKGSNVTIGAMGTSEENKAYNQAIIVSEGIALDAMDDEQNGTGVSATTLKLKATYVAMGWDFTDTWAIQETECYPYMKTQTAPPVITSKVVSCATTISGKAVDGGTVTLEVDGVKQQVVSTGHEFSFTVSPLQAGHEVRLSAKADGKEQSYYTTETVAYLGKGTETDPYLVYTASDLTGVYRKGYYKLMNDIDLTDYINQFSPTEGWQSIGRDGSESIHFDGDGHKITGLWCNSTRDNTGLFSCFANGTIKNLTVETDNGKTVKGGNNTGILIGKMINGTVENCHVSGTVGDGTPVGGMVGLFDGGTISNCQANVTISTTLATSYVGGLVGEITGGEIDQCFTDGTLTAMGSTSYVGGMIGNNSATVTNSYSNATVTSSYNAAGLIAYNYGVVDKCYAIGDLHSNNYAAGVIGYNDGTNAVIKNCVAMNNIIDVTYESQQVQQGGGYGQRIIGGIKNSAPAPEMNNYALSTMQVSVNDVPQTVYNDIMNGTAKTTAELTAVSTYQELGWDFENVWNIEEGTGYPSLTGTTAVNPTDPSSGGGNENNNNVPDTDISSLANVIYLNNTEAKVGTETTLSINMKNSAEIRGFQFDLYLPDGVTVAKSLKGKILGALSAGRLPEEDEHTLTISEQEDGAIRFLCGSQYDETFTGMDGEIATLTVNIADDVEDGDYAIVLRKVKLTETNINNFYETSYVKSTLSISSYTLGDINSDQQIDVSDYIGIANHILGNTPEGFVEKAGDVNEDDVIDVSDYIGVANIILTGSIYGNTNNSRATMRKASVNDMDNVIYILPLATENNREVTLSVRMKNSAAIRGFQFDLYLPEGVTAVKSVKGKIQGALSAGRMPDEDEHTLTFSEQNDGSIRFLCGSQYDETFTGTDGEIATLRVNIANNVAAGNYPIYLKNMKLTETDIARFYETKRLETTMRVVTSADARTLIYETSTTVPAAANNVDVCVIRALNAGEWSTICLPFAMSAAQVKAAFGNDVRLGDFTGCDVVGEDITVNFEEVTAIAANHPYIIKVSTAVTEFTADGVNIAPGTAEVKMDGSGNKYNTFVGTCENGRTLGDGCLFLSDNKFYYSSGSTRIKGLRAYFDLDAAGANSTDASRITISFDDATGISDAARLTNSDEVNSEVFSLSGQRVDTPKKGIYVKGGKKVIMK